MPDEKPHYPGPHGATLRCKRCHKYWPDRCSCLRDVLSTPPPFDPLAVIEAQKHAHEKPLQLD